MMLRKNRRGGMAVEFALIAGLFVVIGAGVVEWGNYLTQRGVVIAAVQEGALAAVSETSAGNYQLVGETQVRNSLNAAQLNGTAATVSVVLAGTAPEELTVSASVPYTSIQGLLPIPVALESQLVMWMEE